MCKVICGVRVCAACGVLEIGTVYVFFVTKLAKHGSKTDQKCHLGSILGALGVPGGAGEGPGGPWVSQGWPKGVSWTSQGGPRASLGGPWSQKGVQNEPISDPKRVK